MAHASSLSAAKKIRIFLAKSGPFQDFMDALERSEGVHGSNGFALLGVPLVEASQRGQNSTGSQGRYGCLAHKRPVGHCGRM